jgi:uncharacterized membrane protein YqjE
LAVNAPKPPDDRETAAIAQALQDVSEKAQLLVREEIELAKTEIQGKVKNLARGAVVGIAGGLFAVIGMLFLLIGFAWLIWYEIFPGDTFFWGFFVMAAILFLLGGLAAMLALRAFKKGSPPKPEMAMQEAQRIKATVQSSEPETTI